MQYNTTVSLHYITIISAVSIYLRKIGYNVTFLKKSPSEMLSATTYDNYINKQTIEQTKNQYRSGNCLGSGVTLWARKLA